MGILTIPGPGSGDSLPLARADGGAQPATDANAAALATLLAGVRAYTPNAETSFGPVTPGTGGSALLAVADVTPKTTGLLQVSVTVGVSSSAPDLPSFAAFLVAPLTAIAGGTPGAHAVTTNPTSTTPAPTGAPVMSAGNATSTLAGGNVAATTLTFMVQAAVGVRTGVAVEMVSTGAGITWTVGYAMSVVEV